MGNCDDYLLHRGQVAEYLKKMTGEYKQLDGMSGRLLPGFNRVSSHRRRPSLVLTRSRPQFRPAWGIYPLLKVSDTRVPVEKERATLDSHQGDGDLDGAKLPPAPATCRPHLGEVEGTSVREAISAAYGPAVGRTTCRPWTP